MILSKQKNKLFSLFQALFVRPSRNRRKFFVLGTLVLVLLLLVPRPAYAFVGGELVIAVLWAILTVCKMFVSLAAMLLAFMLRGDIYYFSNEPVILIGWKICRDICNLFFLLILIFIAFCTILQIEKYHAKKTLLTLIIMALLINFSKPIAIFIFDGSQLLMNYFLNSTGDYTSKVTELSRITDIVYNNLPAWYERWSYKWTWDFDMVVMQITSIIFMFMYAVALIVMAIYLFIRLVALWIIIIVSPFAFLFAVVPDFKKYSDEWWSALFKYCYVGPILAFFLYLSTQLAESSFLKAAESNQKTVMTGNILTLGNAVHFIVVLVFLYASIIVAQKLGIAFASGITSGANKALRYGTGLAAAQWGGKKAWAGTKYAAKAGVRKLDRDVLGSWSPRAFVKGWQKSAEDVERRHLEPGAAGWEDSINKAFGRKKPKDYAKNVQFQSDVEKEMKEQRNVSTQDEALIGVIEKFKGDKSQEARAKTASAMRLLFENNDQNEYMKQYILKNPEEFDAGIQEMTEARLMKEREESKKRGDTSETDDEFNERLKRDLAQVKIDKNAGHNPDALRAALEYGLRRTGMNEDEIGRELFQLGNIALPKGNLGNYGMGTYDAKTEQYKISDSKTNRDHALAKARNIDSQEKMKRLHWNAIFTENQYNSKTGQVDKVGDIHQTGLELLSQMKQTEIKQLGRSRPDLIENCYAGRDKITAAANDYERKAKAESDKDKAEEMRNIAKNMHSFVERVEEEFIGKQNGEAGGTKKKVDRTIKDEYDMDY